MIKHFYIGGFEVSGIPYTYLKPDASLRIQQLLNSQKPSIETVPIDVPRFLSALLHATIPYAFHLQITLGVTRNLHLTRAPSLEELRSESPQSNISNDKDLNTNYQPNHSLKEIDEEPKDNSEIIDTIPQFRSIPNRIWHPNINGTPITSKGKLHKIIDDEYPGIKRNPQFPKLLAQAEQHIDLIEKLFGISQLQHGDITRLAREVGSKQYNANEYISGRHPGLYWLIKRCISKSEAQITILERYKENNGVYSVRDGKHRLATYYPAKALSQAPGNKRRLAQVKRYFEVLERLKDGGFFSDVARELGIWHETVSKWFHGKSRPFLVHLARRIPEEEPRAGYKWLARRMKPGRGFRPTDFFRVPVKISDWDQIKGVLDQLVLLDNTDMRKWHQRFGDIGKEEAFIYVLAMLVSDAGKPKTSVTSRGMDLRLSKAHTWSERIGEANSYYLGKLGIQAQKYEFPSSKVKNIYEWLSEKSPLLSWMMRSCLGLQSGESTSKNSIRANWIFKIPTEIRLRFLQGLNDGDGYAIVGSQRIGNACGVNKHVFKELLRTFNIESRYKEGSVEIIRVESIRRAVELPFFLHATGRQVKANKIVEMLQTRREQKRGVPEDVIKHAMDLHNEGKSYGELSEMIFDQYRLSYSPSTIYRFIKRKRKEAIKYSEKQHRNK